MAGQASLVRVVPHQAAPDRASPLRATAGRVAPALASLVRVVRGWVLPVPGAPVRALLVRAVPSTALRVLGVLVRVLPVPVVPGPGRTAVLSGVVSPVGPVRPGVRTERLVVLREPG